MALSRNKYKLFTKTDFQNIIGKSLETELYNEGIGNNSEYMITYTSLFIKECIEERCKKNLYKIEDDSPVGFKLILGYSDELDENGKPKCGIILSDKVIEDIQLACVYQCDYFLDNGSAERMSGLTTGGNKYALRESSLCELSRIILTKCGLFYSGR